MELITTQNPNQRPRCAECGAERQHLVRMERGGPFCDTCLFKAGNMALNAERPFPSHLVKSTDFPNPGWW